MEHVGIILAGGTGTRLWPISRKNFPKQFLKIYGDKTLLQKTYNRVSKITNNKLYIATTQSLVDLVENDINDAQIIVEPAKVDTAPSIGLNIFNIDKKYSDAIVAFFPADHFIVDENKYIDIFNKGFEFIEKYPKYLLQIGILPTSPNTNLGYIKQGDFLENIDGLEVRKVEKFIEKPDIERAQHFLFSGDYLWNGGYFIGKVSLFKDLYYKYLPDTAKLLAQIIDNNLMEEDTEKFSELYSRCQKISIDYGIIEKMDKIAVLRGNFGWSDIGSWKGLFDTGVDFDIAKYKENISFGEKEKSIYIDSKDNLIFNKSDKLVVLDGIEDLAIVETNDILYISKMKNTEKLKTKLGMIDSKYL